MIMGEHIPVLLNEVIDGLNIKPNGHYLDLTIGRAGHSSVILSQVDETVFKKLGINLTCEAHYESQKLYHK